MSQGKSLSGGKQKNQQETGFEPATMPTLSSVKSDSYTKPTIPLSTPTLTPLQKNGQKAYVDPDLQSIIEAWSILPTSIKRCMLALIDEFQKD